ncbi:Uracil-DNA glycosylase [Reichenbachiella faecimaris]|uniref:Uracil-DNA glycosylase n=1 Tax=Reichenbachiella faecimaris TaxID=692418 RepID=A0A1W2G771_REIFA|nr:uracil-DNA glycosylase family protein [Reichenbachiella faecimaris]SMD32517.1 Uracil-DNA glycosylase [Reichenbachiella faecimaris]
MKTQLNEIRSCTICSAHLPQGTRPVLAADPSSKIVIIGQAPGARVHETGVPWDDKSGENLRGWLGVDEHTFYDPSQIALLPMGFCYPGKGKSGDLPPRPECAPQWHDKVLSLLKEVRLTLLIGQYAQQYYLGNETKKTLTETVRSFKDYLPDYFVLPHPSPRNNIWRAKNRWFDETVLPELQKKVESVL